MTHASPTIAVMSPGDMGHAVGALLRRHGARVITSLVGRSNRTKALAEEAGFEIVADDQTLVAQAQMILSIMVPAQAEPFAEHLTAVLQASGKATTVVDCNAIAPASTVRIAGMVEAVGSRFVDAGIIGPPPKVDCRATRFYASGPNADEFARLNAHGLDIRLVGDVIGDASAIKMCYAALTKGTTALMTGLSLTAERFGISDVLRTEFDLSQAAMYERMQNQVPAMVPKAHRWVGEMEEIAKTFEAAGVPPSMFNGAAAIYQDVAETKLAKVTQEEWNRSRKTYANVIKDLLRRT